MTSLRKGQRLRKSSAPSLPLFDYADQVRAHELPIAARRLALRWRLAPATARVIAELAGFSTERDR
jgi:hypothetical protein